MFAHALRAARVTSVSVLFAALAAGCAEATAPLEPSESAEAELGASYGELSETLTATDLDRWYDVRSRLVAGFDRICGDTICSGDYSNLTTVRLSCSSTRIARVMKDCLWVLGASVEQVDGRTGKLTTHARTFECHVPVRATAGTLLASLEAAGDAALDAPLPGTGASFYDGLVACFDGVRGPALAARPQAFYRELADHQWEESAAAGAAWSATQTKLRKAFDDACGDTFCEGEFADVTPLRLACSVNANSARVSRCAWSFAKANVSVDARGRLSAETATARCDFVVSASAPRLTAALAGPDPLNAPLPGRSSSIYDSLIGCL